MGLSVRPFPDCEGAPPQEFGGLGPASMRRGVGEIIQDRNELRILLSPRFSQMVKASRAVSAAMAF
jgi:hypothetical protein